MDLYQQQQFCFFLQTATERFVARLEERFRGADSALEQIKSDRHSEELRLDEFVDAVFEDFLLNNAAGACFVLQSLAQRTIDSVEGGSVEATLITMAKRLFRELMLQKTIEALELHSGYQSV